MSVSLVNSYRNAASGSVSVISNAQDSCNLFTASKTVTLPTNASGDLMFLCAAHRTDHPTITTPTGWTSVGRFDWSTGTVGNPSISAWRKVSTGAEANVVIPATAGDSSFAIQVLVVRGQHATPIQSTVSTATGEIAFTHPAPWEDIAGTTGGLLVALLGSQRGNPITATATASYGTKLTHQAGPTSCADLDLIHNAIATTGTVTAGSVADGATDFVSKAVTITIVPA